MKKLFKEARHRSVKTKGGQCLQGFCCGLTGTLKVSGLKIQEGEMVFRKNDRF